MTQQTPVDITTATTPKLSGEVCHMLVVGDLSLWHAQGRDLMVSDTHHFITVDALDTAMLADLNPDIVLSPLFGGSFDALDVALRLQKLRYNGPYRAVCDAIPMPNAIRSEIRFAAPQIDFDLIVLPLQGVKPKLF